MKLSFPKFFCEGKSRPATPHPELDAAIKRAQAEEEPVVSYAKAFPKPGLLVPELGLELSAEEIDERRQRVEVKHRKVLAALGNLGVFLPVQAGEVEIEMSPVDERDEGLSEPDRELLARMTHLTLRAQELRKCQK